MDPAELLSNNIQRSDVYDRFQQFSLKPFFLSLTIGIPFCIFKLLFGITTIRLGLAGIPALMVGGAAVTVWAVTDLFMNAGRSLLDLAHRSAPFEYCTIAQLGRSFHSPLTQPPYLPCSRHSCHIYHHLHHALDRLDNSDDSAGNVSLVRGNNAQPVACIPL